MRVLFVTGEVAPFSKTGGLGDVAYALPKALVQKDVDIRVVSPYYSSIPEKYKEQITDVGSFEVRVGWKTRYVGVKQTVLDGVTHYFIDNLDYFNRHTLYGEWDDGERFAFFSLAVIEMMEKINFIPDVIHVNDWHTAMIPALLVDKYHWVEAYRHIRKVLTIHNLRFQGIYNKSVLADLFATSDSLYTDDGVKYFDLINYLKGGISFSDYVTTVSPTYAHEIQTPEFGEGLQDVLRYNSWKIRGILNGIDYDLNNPETDPVIPHHFSIDDLSGKQANRKVLQQRVGLPERDDVPIISCISRLTDQKGFHLIQERMEEFMQMDAQFIVLGTGEPEFEHTFRYYSDRYPDKFRAIIGFDLPLAQLIYAGSDIFLMPSAFEPCGLSQLMSLRYGTIPVVHETGGLRDTVRAYDETTDQGTGFSFYDFDSYTMLQTLSYAVWVYQHEPEAWKRLMKRAMEQDFSWDAPAEEYKNLYRDLTGL